MHAQLQRVAKNIAEAITEFYQEKVVAHEPRFTAAELRAYVIKHSLVSAPASADRILRDLRKKGVLNYQVINRAKSYYLALPLEIAKVDPTDWQDEEVRQDLIDDTQEDEEYW